MDKLEALSRGFSSFSKLSGKTMAFCSVCLIAAICTGYSLWYSNFRHAPQLSLDMAEWQRMDTAHWGRQFRHNEKVSERLLALESLQSEQSKTLSDHIAKTDRYILASARGKDPDIDRVIPLFNDIKDQTRVIIDILEKKESQYQPRIEMQKKPLSQWWWYDVYEPFKLTTTYVRD
jgi:hypothetical protein